MAATNGALTIWSKLHGMFGDWQLALVSYNWGEGSVARAVQRSKLRGKDGTYLARHAGRDAQLLRPRLQAVRTSSVILRLRRHYRGIPNEPTSRRSRWPIQLIWKRRAAGR